ncbi:MAG: class I SAM-dependent methyltransferase [Deltaproteobacteria bacterium]|nr:class I SAM-dependent methyltransferase [Deltaproteobacteria bacterium]
MNHCRTLVVVALLALGGCKKQEPAPKADPALASATTTVVSDAGAAAVTVDAGMSDAERVAKGMTDAETEATKEKARWTPELEKAALALRDKPFKTTTEAVTALLASEHRMPGHKDRDKDRHAAETLTFFGVKPTSTVVEVGAGGGWYTELLAPLLANRGKLVVAGPDPAGPADKMMTVYGKRLDLFLAKSPLFGKVERVVIGTPVKLGADGSADVVLAMREMHNWQRRNELDAYLTAIHAVLENGGILGIEQHRAAAGAKAEETAEKGYLPEEWVIEKVKAAGFELVEKSEINANPKDTKDYPKGVWTLPPNFREGETDRAKYAAIGESDRMTLKFKKVAKQ